MTTSQVPLTGVKVKLPDKVALPKITIPVIKKDPGASSLVVKLFHCLAFIRESSYRVW